MPGDKPEVPVQREQGNTVLDRENGKQAVRERYFQPVVSQKG